MKKQKAMLIKDFYSPDGAIHAGETVIIEYEKDGLCRVQDNMGRILSRVPRHILKEIA
jgi:hypothetical protein